MCASYIYIGVCHQNVCMSGQVCVSGWLCEIVGASFGYANERFDIRLLGLNVDLRTNLD